MLLTTSKKKGTRGPKSMSEEHKSAIIAARKQAAIDRQQRRQKAYKIGKYRVYQADDANWIVTDRDDDSANNYYPYLHWALVGLLHMEIGDATANSIRELLAEVKRIEERIMEVFG
jgi:hypothetical protein